MDPTPAAPEIDVDREPLACQRKDCRARHFNYQVRTINGRSHLYDVDGNKIFNLTYVCARCGRRNHWNFGDDKIIEENTEAMRALLSRLPEADPVSEGEQAGSAGLG